MHHKHPPKPSMLRSDDTLQRHRPDPDPDPDPDPEPQPEEGFVDLSAKWATGKEVDIMKGPVHLDGNGDKDGYIFEADPTLYASHAGGADSADRKIIMTADGDLDITGDMARRYQKYPNYNSEWKIDLTRRDSWAGEKFDSGNISLKPRNRHEYGGANSNKNSDIGVHFDEDYCGNKAELQHNADITITSDKKYPDNKKMKLDEKYHIKFQIFNEPGEDNTIHVIEFVDFNDGEGYTKTLDVTKRLPASLFQKSLYEGDSSIWYRNNGTGTSVFSKPQCKRLP